MSYKIVTPEGKEMAATESLEQFIESLVQTYDEHRAGIIDNSTVKARATSAAVIIAAIRTAIVYQKEKGITPDIAWMEKRKAIEQGV